MVVSSELRTHKVMEAAIRELMGAGTHRQALRDLPANTTDPENPVWPEAPTP
jgi:hypothetical protein